MAGLGLPPMPHPAGSSDTSGLGTQPAPGPFLCAIYLEHAKAAGVNRRLAVALLLRGGVLRRAVLERGLCLPRHGTHGLNEASGALPVCRANDPRWMVDILPAMMLIKPALLTYSDHPVTASTTASSARQRP